MATEEEMDVKERFKYLRMMKRRYEKADRKTKGRLLEVKSPLSCKNGDVK